MKKFILTILILFLLLTNTNIYSVTAESINYLRVINQTTPLYSDTDGDLLFYLPYTYYVSLISEEGNYAHVEISGKNLISIDGYVPKDQLFSDKLEVQSPYPEITLTTINSCVLYSDKNLSTSIQYIFANRTLYYYGSIIRENGNNLYFVKYNEKLGYVRESDIQPFTIENHPNKLTFIPDSQPEQQQEASTTVDNLDKEESSNVSTLSLSIIVCLLLAGVVAIIIVFGKAKTKSASSYYDENDYE